MPSTELNEDTRSFAKRARAIGGSLKDGDIFRKLRYSQIAGDIVEAGRLRDQVSEEMCKNIGRLYRGYGALAKAFDDNLPFAGLWSAFQLGTLSRILGLKCEEVDCSITP